MTDVTSLWAFIVAGLLLNLAPGPDVLYIVSRSVSQGRAAGVVSALGIAAGCMFHVLLAACGLSALLVAQPIAYEVVRYAGAVYLVWLGLKALFSSATPAEIRTLPTASLREIFRQGVITNILNPKVAVFFLSFLPQFADASAGWVGVQLVLLGLLFNFNGTLVNFAYALLAARLGDWVGARFNVAARLNQVAGGAFILLGLRLAWPERR